MPANPVLRFLAWLYLAAPMLLTNLLPDSVNRSDGAFSEAVDDAANRLAERKIMRARRWAARREAGSDAS
jgi:hypothetical protein